MEPGRGAGLRRAWGGIISGMADIPEIRYARSGEVHIAYQRFGAGIPMVAVPPFAQNIEMVWTDPTGSFQRFLRRFGTFCDVTHFDKRGTGLSDRVSGMVPLEDRMDDLRAVMDHAGIERAVISAVSEGGPLAMLFAATYPARVQALVLCSTAAKMVADESYPHGIDAAFYEANSELLIERWATPDSLVAPFWMPSLAGDEGFRHWMLSYERASASPGAVREIARYVRTIDVRTVLATISVPTLIIHRTGDLLLGPANGRYLAEHIAGSTYVELPGIDHVPWAGDGNAVLDAIEDFLTGGHTIRDEVDRSLATVLFTDIVGSTGLATSLGDQRWCELLDRHDAVVRGELERYRGREVKTTGDGFLATFDSPGRALRAATGIGEAARAMGIEVRAGVHTGEVELRGDDVGGVAVHIGARIAALAGPSEVLVSSTVRDLVAGSDFAFADRGDQELKGVPGSWRILALA